MLKKISYYIAFVLGLQFFSFFLGNLDVADIANPIFFSFLRTKSTNDDLPLPEGPEQTIIFSLFMIK